MSDDLSVFYGLSDENRRSVNWHVWTTSDTTAQATTSSTGGCQPLPAAHAFQKPLFARLCVLFIPGLDLLSFKEGLTELKRGFVNIF